MSDAVTAGRRPLRDRIRKRLAEEAVARGADPAKVEEVLDQLESDRPLIDWLLNGGFEKLLKLIMELIALFA